MMIPTRWNPARDLFSIADELNRYTRDVFSDSTRETSMMQGAWHPDVDISEDQNNFYLHVELPGMKREDVKVNYEDGVLTISGVKKSMKEEKDTNYHRLERTFGKFERSFRLPAHVAQDKIAAQFENGVLSISLPKTEETKPKAIEIKVK